MVAFALCVGLATVVNGCDVSCSRGNFVNSQRRNHNVQRYLIDLIFTNEMIRKGFGTPWQRCLITLSVFWPVADI